MRRRSSASSSSGTSMWKRRMVFSSAASDSAGRTPGVISSVIASPLLRPGYRESSGEETRELRQMASSHGEALTWRPPRAPREYHRPSLQCHGSFPQEHRDESEAEHPSRVSTAQ